MIVLIYLLVYMYIIMSGLFIYLILNFLRLYIGEK